MNRPPASGERSALRGYQWQYDHIAALVYDALLNHDLESLRLTDPDAGRVDDLLLIRRGRVDGYQFKRVESPNALTFNDVVRNQRTRSGKSGASLVRALSDGWISIQRERKDSYVHLVTNQVASVNDQLGSRANQPSPDHFSAFLTRVLKPLRLKNITLEDVPTEWRPALEKLQDASGLAGDKFERFLQSLHIDVAVESGLPTSQSTRRSDIIALSDTLKRCVSEASDVVEMNADDVLDLMHWENRPRLRSRHEFPVDLDTYEPLADAIDQLSQSITRHDRGYFAVIGPPGSGKSTLLSQSLSGSTDRIVRYYAYISGTAPAKTRLSARGFLHDMMLMLSGGDNSGNEPELPSTEIETLRQQFTNKLDTASAEFQRTGRRTIIVVDGLDHVRRDYSGNDDLLSELPRPDETPDGVLFIVGSRTLEPLHAYAQQQLHERETIVNLQHHCLPPTAILKICRRLPITKNLAAETHQRIVELSRGYPLALSYLLNRLRNGGERHDAEILAALPAYSGDIEAEYRAIWDEVRDDNDIVDILAVCSRLRNGFTTGWLSDWAPSAAVRTFRDKFLYLFNRYQDRWRFFHDSFRQFTADRTAWGDEQCPDPRMEVRTHRRIADLCANATDHNIAGEQLYHRYCGNQYDKVMSLAQQSVFREQYRRLRSPALIRQDIAFALDVAANRTDVLGILRLLLASVELTSRTSSLENVNMPALLYEAGLVKEAISWCGSETRQVPLAYAYELAAKLGDADDSAGRRLFDQIEQDGLDDHKRTSVAGQEDDAALAWTRAAVLFRPPEYIIAAIRSQVEKEPKNTPNDKHAEAERWLRYRRMNKALIDAMTTKSDEKALTMIDSALAEHVNQLKDYRLRREACEDEEYRDGDGNSKIATLIHLRVRAQQRLLEQASTTDAAKSSLDRLLFTLSDVPLSESTLPSFFFSITEMSIKQFPCLIIRHIAMP